MYKLYGNNPNVMVQLCQEDADEIAKMAEAKGVESQDILLEAIDLYLAIKRGELELVPGIGLV